MTHHAHEPLQPGEDRDVVERTHLSPAGDRRTSTSAHDDPGLHAYARLGTGQADPVATGGVDPVDRWATEHYGFDDDADGAVEPVPAVAPVGAAVTPGTRKRALLAGGVLGLVLAGGVGGAAIASVTDAAGGGGRGGPDRFVVGDVDGDDGRPGGAAMTRRLDVIGAVLLVAAAALGIWLGLAAPDISPIFTEAPLDRAPRGGGRR